VTEDAVPSGLRRAFVAVVPPADALNAVETALVMRRGTAPAALRWTPRDQWHVTLQFLGRVDDAEVAVTALEHSVHDVASFALRLGGGGAFPKPRAATVLWAGVHEGADPLTSLADVVTRATAPLGVAPEDRPYRPHLTLARAARAADLRELVAALDADEPGPAWTVEEVVLFESDTRSDGAVHRIVARCPLAIGERP
jgi:2'-5' RNA ligase